ncbi:MAG TPA: urease accessory protein UreD [Micromonospora sp.]|nr:urease accessory protein UreD [Micromonospora sp.]
MNAAAPARVVVEHTGDRARFVRLDAGEFVGPRTLEVDGARARVALVGMSATLLAGDDLRIEIDVGSGVALEIVEPSGTVAYNARGARAHWSATVRVAAGASLVWAEAPFVVADGAKVHRHTELDLEAGATALLREMLVLGRTGETGGSLRATLHATYDRRPLLVEDLDLTDPDLRTSPGILQHHRVLATAMLLGLRSDIDPLTHQTPLAGPGALARALTDHAHLAEAKLADTWRHWRNQLTERS